MTGARSPELLPRGETAAARRGWRGSDRFHKPGFNHLVGEAETTRDFQARRLGGGFMDVWHVFDAGTPV